MKDTPKITITPTPTEGFGAVKKYLNANIHCPDPSGSPRCDMCRWGSDLEHRYDQVYCFNEDSKEYGGNVEGSSSCELFEENGENTH